MRDFDFDLDIDIQAELEGIRGGNRHEREKPKEKVSKSVQKRDVRKQTHDRNVTRQQALKKGGSSSGAVRKVKQKQKQTGSNAEQPVAPTPVDPYEPPIERTIEPEGLEIKHTQQERFGGGGSSKNSSEQSDGVNWKAFKTIPDLFIRSGGSRPVVLNEDFKKTQVFGLPEPLFDFVQKTLKERHVGKFVDFPWGSYEITDKNKVFTVKTSLVRYMMFDSLRDEQDSHLQYAKQWLVLHHEFVFYPDFNVKTNMPPHSDELDIYALLVVANQDESVQSKQSSSSGLSDELGYELNERLMMMNMNLNRLLERMNEQEDKFEETSERSQVLQTVLLLDRMGLLRGGLPRDVGELLRILEESRDVIRQTGVAIDRHVEGEKERKRTLEREQRLKMMRAQRLAESQK